MSDERALAELRIQLTRVEGRLETLEERIDHVKDGVARNAKSIEILQGETRQKLDSFDGDLSDSKVHLLSEIKAERDALKKARTDSGIWWKRTSIGWVVSAVAALVIFALGVFATWLLHR